MHTPFAHELTIVRDDSESFSESEHGYIRNLNHALVDAYLTPGNEEDHQEEYKVALRLYLKTMSYLSRRYRMFEIANHRMFRAGDSLVVPYDAHGHLSIYVITEDSQLLLRKLRLPHGTQSYTQAVRGAM